VACAPKPLPIEAPAAHVVEWRDQVEWDEAGAEATEFLAGYLAVDSTNPPGNELAAADYLSQKLEAEGITWYIDEFEPGRANLIARLEGGDEPPLCLMSHMDVVTAEADKWEQGPLSGAIVDGELWGRGALDMKSLGAIELMAMVWLKRLKVPLKRDIILLAVSDEEVDNKGAHRLAKTWEDIGCSHLINEGGLGITDAIFEGQTIYGISTVEKGILWTRMSAEGEPGHGSTPMPDQSPDQLVDAVVALRKYKPKGRIPDELMTTLDAAGRNRGGFTGWVLTTPWATNLLVKPSLMGEGSTRALLTNTLNITGFDGALSPNVVPSTSTANVDCRLQPGTSPQDMLIELVRLTAKQDVRFDILAQDEARGSDPDDAVYRALAKYAVEGRDDAIAGPILSPGFTDSLILRPLGVRAYGFAPFEISADMAATMHGHNERIPVDQIHAGLRILMSAVLEVSAQEN